MRDLPHLAARLFGVPLLVDERKLDAIVPAFMRRLNGDPDDPAPEEAAREPGDPAIKSGIAVIPVIGSIVRRKTGLDAFSGLTSYGDVGDRFDCALDDARVRAILFQLDTYGGEQGGCFELCDRILAARGRKSIWAVADINALSAGYAIGSQCDRFFAAPSGMVGSIGVVAVHCETSQMNEALGITYTVFRAGAHKADGNSVEPLSSFFSKKLQASMDRNRQKFVDVVARGRKSVTARAALATEGQWYDAPDALPLKLIDEIGTYEDAFAALAATVPAPAAKPPRAPLAPVEDVAEIDEQTELLAEGITAMTTKPEDDAAAAAAVQAAAAAVPPALPAPVTPAAGNVVSLDSARAEGEIAGQQAAREIAELCKLAGKPALAVDFITGGKSVADVRKALIDAAAEADAATTLSHHQPPRKPTTAAAAMEGWDRAFAQVHAATTPARRTA